MTDSLRMQCAISRPMHHDDSSIVLQDKVDRVLCKSSAHFVQKPPHRHKRDGASGCARRLPLCNVEPADLRGGCAFTAAFGTRHLARKAFCIQKWVQRLRHKQRLDSLSVFGANLFHLSRLDAVSSPPSTSLF